MESEHSFRFAIELTRELNPPGTKDHLQDGLRTLFVDRGVSHIFGNFGGTWYCHGEVGPPAHESDRQAVAEWLAAQRMSATVRLEAMVPFNPSANIDAPISDWVFAVDNLTQSEQAEAAAYYAEMRRRQLALVAARRAKEGLQSDHGNV